MVTKSITPLEIDIDLVLSRMGYRNRIPLPAVKDAVRHQIERAYKIIHPVYVYSVHKLDGVDPPDFTFDSSVNFSSKVVSYALTGCEEVVLYLATLGGEIDKEITHLFSEHRVMDATALDIAGSVAIEKMVTQLRAEIKNLEKSRGLQSTRQYSPGYCDWDIRQQRMLFPVLAGAELGVRLNEACMMVPRKSISGIIGIGKPDKNKKSPCKLFCEKSAICEFRNIK